jgi:hypothetical protein
MLPALAEAVFPPHEGFGGTSKISERVAQRQTAHLSGDKA